MGNLNPRDLRSAFASYMTGVTVVTAKAPDGSPVGFTANSFTSVSLDPPLLLVCPGNHLSSFDVFRSNDHFAINILAEDQEAISNLFASSKGDRFGQSEWTEDQFGSPTLNNVAAHFSCSTFQRIDAGDHIILIGQVEAFANNPAKGLGYASSGYFTLGQVREIAAAAPGRQAMVGALVECDGHVLVQQTEGKLTLPTIELNDAYGAPVAIREHLRAAGLKAEIRQVYSVFDDAGSGEHFTFYRAIAGSPEPSSAGKFVKIDDLNAERMTLPAVTTMMRRFKSEFNNKQFGLFIGNTVSGDVHLADTH